MDWQESADFLEAAQKEGPRAHEDLSGEGDQGVLAIRVLAGMSLAPIRLTPRAADTLAESVGPRCTGPLLDDDAAPLTAAAARRIVNAVARSAGLGDRLDRRSAP
jgi:hypothetical protein